MRCNSELVNFMKTLKLIALVSFFMGLTMVLTTGETKQKEQVDVFVKSSEKWFNVNELLAAARNRIKASNLQEEFANSYTSVWIDPCGSNTLAKIFYSNGMGKYGLMIGFRADGEIESFRRGKEKE
jgi:hypothetical protein